MVSAWEPSWQRKMFPSPSLNPPQRWEVPGITTPTLELPVMSGLLSTSSHSSRTQTGPGNHHSSSSGSSPNIFLFVRFVAPAKEIKEYLVRFAREYDLYRHIQFETRVQSAVWREEEAVWKVVTNKGALKCRILISACGALHKPALPSIAGIQNFKGKSFHSAEWDHGVALDGKRVGIVGSAASAVQIVPTIANKVKELFVFQRTPNWFYPKLDPVYSDTVKNLFRRIPALMTLQRVTLFLLVEIWAAVWLTKGRLSQWVQMVIEGNMRTQLDDKQSLTKQLIPKYNLGCKRVLLSDEFLPVFKNNKSCHLVTDPIDCVTTHGVKTDKEEIDLDIVVYATGFDIEGSICSFDTTGRNNTLLRNHFETDPCAYLGITVPNFPNFFYVLGPNTVLAHSSLVYMIECQVGYIMQTIQKMAELHIRTIEPRKDKTRDFQNKMGEWTKNKNFSASCRSWYKNKDGINFVLWPSNLLQYWWMTAKPNLLEDFKIVFDSEYYNM